MFATDALAEAVNGSRSHFITNTAQFRSLSGEDFLADCAFRLTGAITLVDTNREFLVLQDATGAVRLDYRIDGLDLQAGELVSLEGSNCCPSLARFPDYPHRPSGSEISGSFEEPANWGEYNLSRMRGYLHPPVSGQYTFWIASDNSSELWLSTDAERSAMRRIASVARYHWTGPQEWTKFPSQRSESIWLNAGQSYYIESLHEQTSGGENLAVAWQGPGIAQSVITAPYLTPWRKGRYATYVPSTNGILREYWTNYPAGDLDGVGGARPFQSALSVEALHVTARRGRASLPTPLPFSANQPWTNANNYCWVEAEGTVKFVSEKADNILLELPDSKALMQVRVLNTRPALSRITNHASVHINGVCEATYDESGVLGPGLIWVTTESGISAGQTPNTNSTLVSTDQSLKAAAIQSSSAVGGFYGMAGVVTFNDRVFGKNCLFVQEGNVVMFVSLENFQWQSPLKVGQFVDLGGALEAGKSLPIITPLVITEVGWHSLPTPATDPIQFPVPPDRDGRWTEIQGVVHSVNPNGTLSVTDARDSIAVWLGDTPSNQLSHYVDAKLRAWGVLSLSTLHTPALLVPSRSFVEVDEAAPADPFGAPVRPIADLKRETGAPSLHRAKVVGEITLQDAEWIFVQDATGGIRAQIPARSSMKIGDAVEVLGFPALRGTTRILSDAVVRPGAVTRRAEPSKLDFTEGLPVRQNGNLIRVPAGLLKARTIGSSEILEVQNDGRVFTATLSTGHGHLMEIAPGSQLEITGVCDTESTALPPGTTARERAALASLNIWMRSPDDLKVLGGPPWWTWKRGAVLISALFAISAIALLWVHLLRRRLERQKAVQLAFSEQVLKRLEDERRRIAANLHDGLGQVLLAIRNQALLAMQRSPEENGVRKRLEEISGATSQALEEVRQITHGLRPYQLNRLGLTQAIRASVNQVALDSQIVFASRVEDIDNVFDTDSEIHVYRIVQEAINNILKHSAATEAAVVIKNRTTNVSLSIRDNGRGFDTNFVSASRPNGLGYGLSGIAERVRILGGALTIDSRPGEGTSLSVEIPVQVRNHETGNNHIDRR